MQTKQYDDVIIVTGGTVNPDLLREVLAQHQTAYVIGVDRGLEALDILAVKPNLAIGDFDSASAHIRALYAHAPETVLLNPEKDYTDTHIAVLEALKCEPVHIVMVGATGTRMDHTAGNIALLKICLLHGAEAVIIDDRNRIRMIDRQFKIRREHQYGTYVSCIPFSDRVTGITIRGFRYNLEHATMIKEETIGISNEVREEEGLITVETGYLLVMETRD